MLHSKMHQINTHVIRKRKMKKLRQYKQLYIAVALISVGTADATVWTTPIAGGEIRFDDWGYTGPHGQTAVDFSPINGGFGGPAEGNASDPTGSVGQIQHVVTKDPDGLTPDAPYDFLAEFTNTPLYPDGNTDTAVNFYNWGYTTVGGSVFNNMQIDVDGDYLVKRDDMQFKLYKTFEYINEGVDPIAPEDGIYATTIHFQPYALSDAIGWCGSTMATNPGALEGMAGQVQFDFGFEVFFSWSPKDENGDYPAGTGSMQLISGFQMRSYGTVTLDVTLANGGTLDTIYESSAVVNNTNPIISNINLETGLKEVGGGSSVDGNYYNQVSFMGAGIIKSGVWVLVDSNAGVTTKASGDLVISNDQVLKIVDGVAETMPTEEIPAGTEWMYHKNFFANYPFLMRADGIRVIEAMDYATYSDLSNVPTVVAGVAYNDDEYAVSQPVADITGTPNAFAFTDQTNVALNTLTTSNTLVITGLIRETVISVTGGEYNINGGDFTSARGVIVSNDTVQLRTTSSNSVSTTVDVVLTIGSVSDTFSVTTEPADTTPNSFSFNDQFNLGLNELIYSNSITVTGINTSTSIDITAGEYSINGNGYTTSSGTVSNGDVVTVRHWTAATDLSTVNTVLNIGGVTDTFSSSTQIDTTPDAFSFTDQVDVGLDTTVVSDSITVTGINSSSVISITGGEYSINGGAYQSTNGSVSNGNYVNVRTTSDTVGSSTTGTTLTIGGVSDTFDVTTASDVDADGLIDTLDNCINVANADQLDTDGDLYGNACDADFNNDGIVNSLDTGPFKADFFTAGNVETDLNGDAIVNSLDLGIYKQKFTLAPGPSGLNP